MNRRSFLKALGLAPLLPTVAAVAPLVAAPAVAPAAAAMTVVEQTAWEPVIEAIAVGPNGDIYVGGTFSMAGPVNLESIVRWNGAGWDHMLELPAQVEEGQWLSLGFCGIDKVLEKSGYDGVFG